MQSDFVIQKSGSRFLSDVSFALLEHLHQNPRYSFVKENQKTFDLAIKQPISDLLFGVKPLLHPMIPELMETEKGIFSHFNKNDFGLGGANHYYWGAYYPKGTRRTFEPQLIVSIDPIVLGVGFCIGKYGQDPRIRLRENWAKNKTLLIPTLSNVTKDGSILLGDFDIELISEKDYIIICNRLRWDTWLDEIGNTDRRLCKIFPKKLALSFSLDEFTQITATIFNRLFPFLILSMYENPMPIINEYLKLS